MKKGSFGGGNPFQDDPSIYGSSFAAQKRTTGDATYMDSLAGFPQARDPSLPPSRQSQGSPAFQDMYHGHTPSNSIHSQRAMANHASSFSTQSANQRAFNLNKQIDDDLPLRFSRQAVLDNASNASNVFNPASQPFQFNPGSQSWMSESSSSRYGGTLDMNTDSMAAAAQYAAMKRASVDRISPSSAYRLESNNSPRNYAASPDTWQARPSSRDHRSNDGERRGGPQHFASGFPSYYPSQYPYANLAAQYPHNFMDPYNQNLRHALMSSYMPPVPAAYPLPAGLAPGRPSRDQDPGKGVRSALLDEFRLSNKSSKRFELKEIYNHVVEFSGDQHGSRFIQQKLESANSDEKDQVFREIEPNAIQLMKDVFGNYVVQKFFEHGNQVQKKVLAERMKGKVVDLSVQVYACRVVQKVKTPIPPQSLWHMHV